MTKRIVFVDLCKTHLQVVIICLCLWQNLMAKIFSITYLEKQSLNVTMSYDDVPEILCEAKTSYQLIKGSHCKKTAGKSKYLMNNIIIITIITIIIIIIIIMAIFIISDVVGRAPGHRCKLSVFHSRVCPWGAPAAPTQTRQSSTAIPDPKGAPHRM